MSHLIPIKKIEDQIFVIREHRVMLDADLAKVYGVTTKRLNEQVKRNSERFPSDFMFQLTQKEKEEVVANCDHLFNIRFASTLPYAFTEHGAIMLANILRSPRAVQASIQVVRAFVRLRELLMTHKELNEKLEVLERKYDSQFKVVFDAIRRLMDPPNRKSKLIGFQNQIDKAL